jgi:AraC-like DNA-binding protein
MLGRTAMPSSSPLTAPARLRIRPNEPRHSHGAPFAVVILGGAYDHAGYGGRFRAAPGDVLVHGPFTAHRNRPLGAAEVLALPLPLRAHWRSGRARVGNIDELLRLARDDLRAAARMIAASAAADPDLAEPPDRLRAALRADPGLQIAAWAHAEGVSRATAFRGFVQAYGVPPSRFRVEARARLAWRLIVGTARPLAEIAIAAGFADQAHMTRDVRALTGRHRCDGAPPRNIPSRPRPDAALEGAHDPPRYLLPGRAPRRGCGQRASHPRGRIRPRR